MSPQANKYIFLTLLSVFIVTFFTRNTFRNVDVVCPEVLEEPIQTEIYDPQVIQFTKDTYEYTLTPLYDYEINGLIVGKMNYRIFSLDKFDNVFPADLCMIWGSNVASKVYRNRAVKFSQDCRWCWVEWWGNIEFNLNEISNNHLLINNKYLERRLKNLLRGDQVKIKGKLVSLNAKPQNKPDAEIYWRSSTTREDTGAGACEVIYVEDIQVLKEANVLSGYLYRLSSYGLILWLIANIFGLFRPF